MTRLFSISIALIAVLIGLIVYEYEPRELYCALLRNSNDSLASTLLSLRLPLFSGVDCLLSAVEKDDARLVRLIVASDDMVDAHDATGHNVVMLAAHRGFTELVRILLTQRNRKIVDVNLRTGESMNTALHESAAAGHAKTTELLLSSALKADVNARNAVNNTPLHFAASNGHERVVQLLLAAGADRNARNQGDETPIELASGKAFDYLYKKFYPLHFAAKMNDVDNINKIIEKSPELVNARDYNKITPLHWAALNGYGDIVDILIEANADVNSKDKNEWTPLHNAASNGFEDLVQLFIDNGADFRTVDANNWTPLYHPVINDHVTVVETLLRNGVDASIGNSIGVTPLHEAAEKGTVEMTKLLLSKGKVPVNLLTQRGESALIYACRADQIATVKLLLENGADPTIRDALAKNCADWTNSKTIKSLVSGKSTKSTSTSTTSASTTTETKSKSTI